MCEFRLRIRSGCQHFCRRVVWIARIGHNRPRPGRLWRAAMRTNDSVERPSSAAGSHAVVTVIVIVLLLKLASERPGFTHILALRRLVATRRQDATDICLLNEVHAISPSTIYAEFGNTLASGGSLERGIRERLHGWLPVFSLPRDPYPPTGLPRPNAPRSGHPERKLTTCLAAAPARVQQSMSALGGTH